MSDKLKILAADTLAKEGLDYIQSQPDAELTNKPGLSEQELAAIVGEHDGMIVRSGVQVTSAVLETPGRLRGIVRAGVGVDNIDLQAATRQGILVMNSAEASTITTAEHAFALMMALARNIGPAYMTMAQGGWDRKKYQGRQLSGKTLGVVGFGRIGSTVAERALAFGMQVVGYDPFINAETVLDGRVKMFRKVDELLPHADILTFHVPLNDQTRGLMNDDAFAKSKQGVMVVNASRGGVIDEQSVLKAVESGQCGGAALDVFGEEPLDKDSPLRGHPRILTTPHLGASTVEAQLAVSVDAAAALLAYLRGEGVRGAVNAGGLRVDLDPIQTCFVDLAQRMAIVLSPMLDAGIGSVKVLVSGSSLATAAGTIDRTVLVGLLRPHMDGPVNIVNVRHLAEQRGICVRTETRDEDKLEGPQLVLEVTGGETVNRIAGRVYQDMKPRVTEINGYNMDIIPEGIMVLIKNQDQPGMIGTVGSEFGEAGVNIADMAISRRDGNALMVLKVDGPPPEALINRLCHRPGILKVATIQLPSIGA